MIHTPDAVGYNSCACGWAKDPDPTSSAHPQDKLFQHLRDVKVSQVFPEIPPHGFVTRVQWNRDSGSVTRTWVNQAMPRNPDIPDPGYRSGGECTHSGDFYLALALARRHELQVRAIGPYGEKWTRW